VAYLCRNKIHNGKAFCVTDCPSLEPGVFLYSRVAAPADLPARDDRIVDVAILDMNHGAPNLGHDSIVHAVMDASCDLIVPAPGHRPAACGPSPSTCGAPAECRRRRTDASRSIWGPGGPGHLDPRLNDGVTGFAQGIAEDPSWEAPLFALFDSILAHPDAALLSVCHTFGVMCGWAGTARAVLRGPEKGGKSAGILDNLADRRGPRSSLVPSLLGAAA
jgi:hypothetical protein